MKIEQVIEELQELQKLFPGIEVTDGSAALYFVDVLPAYYDGCYVKLKQDESIEDEWNIIGAKMESEGYKCVFHFMSARNLCWEDCVMENEDFFEYTESSERKDKEWIDKEIAEAREFQAELDDKMFKIFLKDVEKYKIIQTPEEGVDQIAQFSKVDENGKSDRLFFRTGRSIMNSRLFEKVDMGGCFEWNLKKN